MKITDEKGFTIIELMIATAAFSVVLIIVTAAIIGISNTYVTGSVEDQTQESARAILSDVSNDIEFNNLSTISLGNLTPTPTPTNTQPQNTYYFCIGNDVYLFNLDQYVSATDTDTQGPGDSSWGLVRYTATSCPSSAPTSPPNSNYSELLSANERLGELNVTEETINGTEAFTINVEVAYGSNALLNDVLPNPVNGPALSNYRYKYTCQDANSDSDFCAVSTLTTTIAPRIND